jgi:hypothetical protein
MSNVVLFRMHQSNCLVGVVEDKTADAWHLSAVAVVRYWGTTKGFPELCTGPIKGKTILDVATIPRGTLAEVMRSSVHYTLPCDAKAWAEVFDAVGR